MTKKRNTYLDYNATSAIRPDVRDAMLAALGAPLNSSSVHAQGRAAKKLLENARAQVQKALSAEGAQVIFTASGTEANTLALQGFPADQYLISAVEHASVLKPLEGRNVKIIPVDGNGVVILFALEELLKQSSGKTLVSVMLANNETGVIQPIKEIATLVYKYKGFIHCDAAQAVGKILVNFNELNVDMLSLSGHKFGGPLGAAALIIKKGIALNSVLKGGGQEFGYRAGTENVPAIAGLAKAAEGIPILLARMEKIADLRDYLEDSLLRYAPEATIYSAQAPRLPNTTNVAMPGMKAETQVINFDLEGIAISAGSACSSGKVGQSHVLQAMGIESGAASRSIRVSLTPNTTAQEIEEFIEVWKKLYNRGHNLAQAA